MIPFLTTCDKFRTTQLGESQWSEMIDNGEPVSIADFLSACDPSGMLDDGESFGDVYAEAMRSDHWTNCFKSSIDGELVYYFFTAGFEFIFKAT